MPELSEDLQIPQWLTEDYVESALQSYLRNEAVCLCKCVIEAGMKKGDGYTSIMYRLTVEYESKTSDERQKGNYLLKIPHDENGLAKTSLMQFDAYNREIEAYESFLPQIKSLLVSGEIRGDFYPETIFIDKSRMTILFENLAVKSYKCDDPVRGLSLTQAKMVLEKVARMHAASAKLNESCPGIFKNFNRGLFNRHTDAFINYFFNAIEHCAEAVSEWDTSGYYVNKLRNLRPYVMEYGKRSFDVNPNFFNVLCHGDLWTNNIMFQFDETNKPVDILLIDFQFSCYCSPAVDLSYFLHTSLNEDVRRNHEHELLQYYYYELANCLEKLNFNGVIPSLTEFLSQCLLKGFYYFISGCLIQPIFHTQNIKNADFAAVMGTDERSRKYRKSLFENPRTKENLKYLIPLFDQRGFLDLVEPRKTSSVK